MNQEKFDNDKVESIKSQIDSGTFYINPESIAEKMIEESKTTLTNKGFHHA